MTSRLRLRALAQSDADRLLELDTDPEVRRYVNFNGKPSRADLDAAMPRMLATFGSPPVEPAFWATEELATSGFIGWFHLRPGRQAGTLELGYRLQRDTWGRGLATEGARALAIRAFEHLGADAVEATALEANTASIRVMEKVGLSLCETFLHEDRYPGVRFSLSRADYEVRWASEGADRGPSR